MRPPVLLLAAALMLAGCTDDKDPDTPTPTADPAPYEMEDPASDLTPEPAVITSTYEGEWAVGYSAGGQQNTMVGTSWPTHTATGNVTGVVIKMTWTPTSSASDQLRLVVDHEDDPRASVVGPSPLTLVFEGEAAAGQYYMAGVAADEPDAYVLQGMTFTVTVVTDGPFDAATQAA